jgi:hypothetical protein
MFVGCPLAVVRYSWISFLGLFHVKYVIGKWAQFSTYPVLWVFHTVVQVHLHEQAWLFLNRPVWCDKEEAWCVKSKAMIFATPPTVSCSKVFNRLFPCITHRSNHRIDIVQ